MQGTIGKMFVNEKIIRIYSIHFIIEIYSTVIRPQRFNETLLNFRLRRYYISI